MTDRRNAIRRPLDFFFNKFLQGSPYLCRAVDVSTEGILIETFVEPEHAGEPLPLELRLPDEKDAIWVMARPVRRMGSRQAFAFLGLSVAARGKLERCLLGNTHLCAPH